MFFLLAAKRKALNVALKLITLQNNANSSLQHCTQHAAHGTLHTVTLHTDAKISLIDFQQFLV